MESRPNLKLKLSPADKFIEGLSWLALCLLWMITLLIFQQLPDIIPVHFNASGKVDDYGNKITLILLPVIGTLVFIGLTVLNRHPNIFNFPVSITDNNVFLQYTNATRMVRFLRLSTVLVVGLVVVIIFQSTRGKWVENSIWFLPLIAAILLLPLTYFTIRAFKLK